jgi:hypothetical protein
MLSSRVRAVLLAGALIAVTGTGAIADPLAFNPPDDQNACLEVEGDFDPGCVPSAAVGHNARQACDYQFLPGCELTAFADPGYAVDHDPSPDGAYDWKVGAVHEHSGYSDGDPGSVPRDYFNAARTGVNGDGTGVRLDYLFSSEHSDNAQITITTNASCLSSPQDAVTCAHVTENSFYWKWPSTLRQAVQSSTDEFTAIRGFEWTNDFYNHMNVFFSTNFRNVKIDGSYASMERMWEWLQRPVAQGGGADGLVTFNHPGGNPKLSPFDGGLPHTGLLAQTGKSNWNEVAYVPAVADRVVGMEINGGEDIEWFIRALTNGWRISPVAAEDHHGTSWASRDDHKTLILTKGRTPQDYYWAFANRRTIAIHPELVDGAPGEAAVVPTIDFTADGGHLLGSVVDTAGAGTHTLRLAASGLPVGTRVALIGSDAGQTSPIQLGTATDGSIDAATVVPLDGDDWYFAVFCLPGAAACGTNQEYSAVTAPIWFED